MRPALSAELFASRAGASGEPGQAGERGGPPAWTGDSGAGSREGLRVVGSQPEAALGSLAGALVLDRGNVEKAL